MPIVFLKDGKIIELADAFKKDDGRYDSTNAGEKRDYTVEIRNDLDGDAVYISAKLSGDPAAKLVDYPTMLKQGETGEILIHFAPDESREGGFSGEIKWDVDVL